VGAILIKEDNADTGALETNYCGATLIADDMVITASHCLDHRRFPRGASCLGKAFVAFPAVPGFSAEKVECQSVLEISSGLLYRSSLNFFHQDYAVIRLARPVRRPVAGLSNQGLPNGELMQLFVPDDDSGATDGDRYQLTIKEKSCPVSQGSVVLSEFRHSTSGMGFLSPCLIVVGNSGSAVLDGQNQIRALITGREYASDRLAIGRGPLRFLGRELFDLVQHPSHLAGVYATNLACVALQSLPFNDRRSDGHCDEGFYRDPRNWIRLIEQANESFARTIRDQIALANNRVRQWVRSNTDARRVRWRYQGRRFRGRYEARPVAVCLRNGPEIPSISIPTVQVNVTLDAHIRTSVTAETHNESQELSALPPCYLGNQQ
jgi:hypothetical protein